MSGEESVVYRTCTPVVDARYDPVNGPSLSEAVVDALAQAADQGPTELSPLYHVVDLDALALLFAADRKNERHVYSFTYQEWQVFISGDGRIRVCDTGISTTPAPVFDGERTQ